MNRSGISKRRRHNKYAEKAPVIFTAIVTTLVLICVLTISGLVGSSEVAAGDKQEYITVKVKYGDTLWNIAKTYGPENRDIRDTIQEICDINGINASTLMAGTYIEIPVYK